MKDYQREFVEFLLDAKALMFGEFVLKSGRKAPFFFNTGLFNTGDKIERLGGFYATHIEKCGLHEQVDVLFGPAYKGIPLAVIISSALFRHSGTDLGFAFDRKEAKDHGDTGMFVGAPLNPGTSVLIVEDVVTAGTTINAVVQSLGALDNVKIGGVVISLDRCERGSKDILATEEVYETHGFRVHPVITIYDVLQFLEENPGRLGSLQQDLMNNTKAYLKKYGPTKK